MARIIGGLAVSHTPTIGFAYDKSKQSDPVWKPIFANFAPFAEWLAEKRPDVMLMIYNDHMTSFFVDHYSAFALGVGSEWPRVCENSLMRSRSESADRPDGVADEPIH